MENSRVTQARNGDLVVFAINGVLFATWMSRIPDVKAALALTPGQLGVLLLALSVGALIGLPTAGRIAHRIGAAATVRLGLLLTVPGALLAALAVQFGASPMWVSPGLFLFGLGNGIWDVAQNLEGTRIELGLKKAIMPWFHAAFSGGTVAAALLGAGLVKLDVSMLVHVAAISVLSVIAVMWGTARFLPTHGEEAGAVSKPASRSAWTEPRTLLIGLIVLVAAFTEGTANDWLAVAFVEGHGVEPALGIVAFATFLTFMTAGRMLGTGLLDRYGRVAVLRVLFAAAVLGCGLVVFGSTPVAFMGAACWGVGASLGFPVGMSAAADDPERAALRLSVVATIGYLSFLSGPPLLGFLGDHFGVLRALSVVGVMSLFVLLLLPAARPLPAATDDGKPPPAS